MPEKRCSLKNKVLYRFQAKAPGFKMVKIDFPYDKTLKIVLN